MILEILLPIFVVVAISVFFLWWFDPLRAIPGPPGLPLLGNTLDLTRTADVHSLTRKWQKKYGDIFKYYVLFGGTRVHLSDPDMIKYVQVTNASNYIRPSILKRLLPGLGDGLLTTNGPEHALMRKMLNPKFSYGSVKQFASVFNAKTDELIQNWAKKLVSSAMENIKENILQNMCNLTLDIIGLCAFGYKFNCMSEGGSKMSTAFNKMLSGEINFARKGLEDKFPLLKLIPSQERRETKDASDLCQSILSDVIEKRRKILASGNYSREYSDLLQTIMTVCDEDSRGLSDQEISDHVFTFMAAGHDTTSLAMSWTLMLLAMHQNIQKKVREEIKVVLGDSNEVKWEDLDKFRYLENCINEAMRLYPSVTQFLKTACREDTVGGYFIPAGTKLMIGLGTLHRNEKLWDNPNIYDPGRFDVKRNSSDSALRDCFLPFGRGPRICIGAKFAQVEMKIVLAKILQTFHFKFDTHASAGDLGSILMMTLKPYPPPFLEIDLVDKPRQPSR